MKQPIRISNSAKDKFNQCGEKYRLHYLEKLRSPKVYSSLFFGNALDDAFSRLLLDKKVTALTEAEDEMMEFSAEEIFYQKMLECKNDAGQIIQVPKSPLADYYTSDFDSSLFTTEVIKLVEEMDQNYNTLPKIVAFHDYCKKNLNYRNKERVRLQDGEFILYNYLNWLSLVEKGKLMVQAYRDQIIPHIHEVFSIQKHISIKNEFGDEITGKIDFIASFTDEPNTKYICDNKTASKVYSDNSVLESEQLATYAEAEGISHCAYVVVQKTIFKKEPKIKTQIIKGIIPEEMFQKTFDIYEKACYTISNNEFERNFNSCFDYGKLCPYYSLCKHNNSDHLIDCKSKDKEDK